MTDEHYTEDGIIDERTREVVERVLQMQPNDLFKRYSTILTDQGNLDKAAKVNLFRHQLNELIEDARKTVVLHDYASLLNQTKSNKP